MAANNIRKKSDMYLIYYLSTAFAVILFATVFVYFANMLFLKIRKKEFAIYFLLGVRKKEIGQILDNAVKYSRDDGEISIYGINANAIIINAIHTTNKNVVLMLSASSAK